MDEHTFEVCRSHGFYDSFIFPEGCPACASSIMRELHAAGKEVTDHAIYQAMRARRSLVQVQ
jgi:hypothetical protein